MIMANSFERDARNLAEATLRLVKASEDLLKKPSLGQNYNIEALVYSTDDAKGEAKNILAKTVGA
jgi:hypothetical protein